MLSFLHTFSLHETFTVTTFSVLRRHVGMERMDEIQLVGGRFGHFCA